MVICCFLIDRYWKPIWYRYFVAIAFRFLSVYLFISYNKTFKCFIQSILNYISLSQFVAKTCKRSCENASKHDVTSDFPKLWIFFLDIGLFATFVVIVFEVENGIKVLRDTFCFTILNIDIYIEHWIQINV